MLCSLKPVCIRILFSAGFMNQPLFTYKTGERRLPLPIFVLLHFSGSPVYLYFESLIDYKFLPNINQVRVFNGLSVCFVNFIPFTAVAKLFLRNLPKRITGNDAVTARDNRCVGFFLFSRNNSFRRCYGFCGLCRSGRLNGSSGLDRKSVV